MKATKTELKGEDILEFVLFIFSIVFLSYVLIKCIEGFRLAAHNRETELHCEESVVVLMPDISTSQNEPIVLSHLEDDRTPEEKRLSSYSIFAQEVGEEFDIDPNLILAVCEVESRYNPDIVGGGAVGLMQLIPFCHRYTMSEFGYSSEDLFDPYKNMRVGSKYLSELVHRYNDITFALTCYNRGEGAALASGTKTSSYSNAVMTVYNRLSGGDIS